jgi:GT2 family glycosyltransferase
MKDNEKIACEYVFVLVVYNNYHDLYSFLTLLRKKFTKPYKVIVVNSFFSSETRIKIKQIAERFDCFFIDGENKGYGFGNNSGISFALNNLNFHFLICCNCDIDIISFDYNAISNNSGIFAPKIKTIRNRNQNPHMARDNNLSQFLIYLGNKKQNKLDMLLGRFLNIFDRDCFLAWNAICPKNNRICFAPHGCFIIFTIDALKKLFPPFDEHIFLFAEESDLAHLCKEKGVPVYYCPKIKIRHFEDGSTKGLSTNLSTIARTSSIYWYEKWHKGRKK